MQRDAIRGAMKKLFYGLGMLILIGLSAFILMIWGMFVCMGAVDWLGLGASRQYHPSSVSIWA